jgi:peptide/nickel transport system permease protein
MSTEATDERGRVDRLLASPFLSSLLSNRLALAGLAIIGVMLLIALYARIFIDRPAVVQSQLGSQPVRAPPSSTYWFGTDGQARDIFRRVLYGAWIALKFGTITVATSTILGVGLGTIAAYYGDVTDNVIMRTMDVLLAFPSLLLALALVAIVPNEVSVPVVVLGPIELDVLQTLLGESVTLGLWRAATALMLVYTPRFARVVRGAALKVLEDEFIEATEALGASDVRVLVRHMVPNTLAPITVQSTLNFGLAIIDLAALSFLGFGAQAGTPSWGLMLSNGVRLGLLAGDWWWSFFPGLFLAITVLGFNLLGDGMRDALDPRMREAVD